MSGIPAWWTRHARWWDDQRLYLRSPRLDGVLNYDEPGHVALWNGKLQAADQWWPIQIRWGPGTPFFPPRFYPMGCTSRLHQLHDGSMCLLGATRAGGWHGVQDLGVWLDRAVTWFEGYTHENWAADPVSWMLVAPWLPGPEHRSLAPPTLIIAIPPPWRNGPPRGVGSFHARIPRDRCGLGAVVSFKPHCGKKYDWKAGAALVQAEHEEIRGIYGSREALAQREPARFIRREFSAATVQNKPLLTFYDVPLPEDSGHAFACHFVDIHGVRALYDLRKGPEQAIELQRRFGPWPGLYIDPSMLELRRRIGREDDVSERIASTEFVVAGLGALGSEVVHLLAKEGAKRFLLIDGDILLPGNVARHRAGLDAVGRSKVDAMKRAILAINPDAQIFPVQGWIDDLAPILKKNDGSPVIGLGMTGDEGSEHFLDEMCQALEKPCLHAWLERSGEVLRLFRVCPGKDPTLRALSTSEALPFVPPGVAGAVDACADLVLPGSAANVHAAANFVARVALDLAAGRCDEENHWLFAPNGIGDADPRIAPELRRRYGVAAFNLQPG